MNDMSPLFRAFGATLQALKKMAGDAPAVVAEEQQMVKTAARLLRFTPGAQSWVMTWGDLQLWAAAWYCLHVLHTRTIAMSNIHFNRRDERAPDLGRHQLQCADAAMWLWVWFRLELLPNMAAMDDPIVDSLENIREVKDPAFPSDEAMAMMLSKPHGRITDIY